MWAAAIRGRLCSLTLPGGVSRPAHGPVLCRRGVGSVPRLFARGEDCVEDDSAEYDCAALWPSAFCDEEDDEDVFDRSDAAELAAVVSVESGVGWLCLRLGRLGLGLNATKLSESVPMFGTHELLSHGVSFLSSSKQLQISLLSAVHSPIPQ